MSSEPDLVASTAALPAAQAADLLALVADDAPVSWVRDGEGLVGWGTAASVRTSGPTRFADAAKWWAELVARSRVDDAIGVPGSGLVAFGSFAFADGTPAAPGEAVLQVPAVVVGRRGDQAWVTTIGPESTLGPEGTPPWTPAPAPVAPAPQVSFADDAADAERWQGVVAEAVARIRRGELAKVVLARAVHATSGVPIDVRAPLARLAEAYPMCWTFHVDGLFGATPELLVRREHGRVTSRVLAGTLPATGDSPSLAAALAGSGKDLEEHAYAVRSVADALEPHCVSLDVPEEPFVLHLPNVVHLATDVAGTVRDGVTALQLAEALHPSAAVGGTPRPDAVALIAEIEGLDRGRYAGPVGWVDAHGDGEWGIALRSAELSPDRRSVRLFAGCGIVADSDPATELVESRAKLVPVRDALA